MKKIHLVYKTHLDIGFTDLAENVINNYNENYIPRAIELAFELNEPLDKPIFIWTTGSYLIWQYLNTQNEVKTSRLIEAINKGYIVWHALPVTFNTEAATKETMEFALSIAKKLDKQFGKETIAAKMTDVPGHTIGLVDLLCEHDIKFFHVGMNGVSTIPSVPDNFLWKHNDHEVIVSYSKGYGELLEFEGIDEKLCFMHTHDNSGPQSAEKVISEIEKIQAQYPDYEIFASTMDEFAKVVWEHKDSLPVVEEEIGDTWIHGIASDPKNMSDYYLLMNMQKQWIKDARLVPGSIEHETFNANLMLIPEHTWGMDIKRYFSDYKNYDKAAFQLARELDNIVDEDLTFAYEYVKGDVKPEMKYTQFEWENSRSYELYESSWKEQRKYVDRAIAALPKDLQDEALKTIALDIDIKCGNHIPVNRTININGFDIMINENGAICKLVKDSVEYASADHVLGELNYTVFGLDSYTVFRKNYTRRLDECSWAIDLFKPGMEIQSEITFTSHEKAVLDKLEHVDNSLIAHVLFPEESCVKYGAPKKCMVKYTFEDNLKIEVLLTDKDAIRLPEGLWVKFNPVVANHGRYRLEKLKFLINPLDVVNGGNKIQHALDDSIIYDACDRKFAIKAINNRLVSIGKMDMLAVDDRLADIENGFYFNLLNTTWGTNYTMWYEEDIKALYEFNIK